MVHLGKTSRYLRESKGLTQRAMADALGVSYVHLCNIENNKAAPSQSLIDRYRELWGIDLYILAWCLYGDLTELPEPVRKPMKQLAEVWIKELGDLAPDNRRSPTDAGGSNSRRSRKEDRM